ncbi:MAG: FAD-dependent oxidoreductase [Clostridiales bacterium]|nr:FAD-dependent oxidoreductase [Clostridiales bacterium]
MKEYDIVIVGGGPAGLAAAISAKENGISQVLILERDKELGGILNQCIHNGFGLHTFKEELTGPEYAARFIEKVKTLKIEYKLNTMVADISKERIITAISREDGLTQIKAKAVVLAMGCRERSRGALNIPGYRPAGIFSAGTAQRLVNMEGYMPGREVVILGSGDIGLIMARRMTLEGARVKVVAELMPYSGGLKRNIVQCLDDFGIPLKLSHTVVDIDGKDRVRGVTLAEVGKDGKPIPGTEEYISCDTLLLSVGLLPENELSRGAGVALSPVTGGPVVNESLETNLPGVFACGNVLHVHDLVDYVSEEAHTAGKNAAKYVQEQACGKALESTEACENTSKPGKPVPAPKAPDVPITLKGADGVRYTVPSAITVSRIEDTLTVRFRVGNVYKNAAVCTYFDDECVSRRKKMVLAPGEMENVILKKKDLESRPGLKTITIRIEQN